MHFTQLSKDNCEISVSYAVESNVCYQSGLGAGSASTNEKTHKCQTHKLFDLSYFFSSWPCAIISFSLTLN